MPASKIWSPGTHGMIVSDPADPPEVVAATALRNLPSTHAGGQDDVSSQANCLKLDFAGKTHINNVFIWFR